LKATFRIVQKIVYRETSGEEPVYAVAEKQLYASHYFQTVVDLTVCVKDAQRPGFYIITVKGSKQAGLTGLKGGIVRKVAVDQFFAREGPRDDKTKAGVAALAK
jgi:hypothetical protein